MDAYEFSDVKPVIISAVIVLNIIMNCLVIAVIARYPALREDRTTLFICSLCVSDLAGGITAMPISAALCSRATPTVRLSTRYLPEIQMFCLWWFGFNSLHNLSWVALSKIVAILKPFRYEQLLTRNRCNGTIVINLVVGAALAAAKFEAVLQSLLGVHLVKTTRMITLKICDEYSSSSSKNRRNYYVKSVRNIQTYKLCYDVFLSLTLSRYFFICCYVLQIYIVMTYC